MLARELRNPLAPISTAAQMPKIGGTNEKRVRHASDVIDRQVRHMTKLVDDLLDVSCITRELARAAGFHHHFVKPMDVGQLDQVLEQVALAKSDKNVWLIKVEAKVVWPNILTRRECRRFGYCFAEFLARMSSFQIAFLIKKSF
jgi:hypothetical protein